MKSTQIREKHIHVKISTLKLGIIRIPVRWRHQRLIIILKQFWPRDIGNDLNSENTWNEGFFFSVEGF